MAYRFNPPPNWQIDDPNWTPPPGWQPDPAWGPAPEGWNFWVEGEAAPADQASVEQAPAEQAPAEQPMAPADEPSATGQEAPLAEDAAPAHAVEEQDDATRIVSVGSVAPSGEDQAPAAEDPPLGTAQEQTGTAQDDPSAESGIAPQSEALPAEQASFGSQEPTDSAPAAAPEYTGSYAGAADAYGSSASGSASGTGSASAAPFASDASSSDFAVAEEPSAPVEESTSGTEDSAPASAATAGAVGAGAVGAGAAAYAGSHRGEPRDEQPLATDAETGAGAEATGTESELPSAEEPALVDADATHIAGTDQQAAAAPVLDDDATHVASTDQQAQVADGTEASATSSSETAEYQGPDLQADLAQQAPYETATGAEQQGSAPAEQGQDAAAAAPAYGQDGGMTNGYGQQGGYGDQSSSGYGQQGSADGYGQASPAGYGQQDQAAGYGQASPAGYGQASPAGYGQGSASDYAAPAFGQGSPATSPGGWTATTGPNEAPKKGVIARFWWVGCIALVLVFALIAAIVGIVLFTRGGNDEAGGGGDQTTTAEETTVEEDPTATEEEPTDEETTEDEEEYVSPDPTTPVPTMPAEGAQTQEVISDTGTANVTVHMQWQTAENLPSSYGGTIEPAEFGEYLVVTAQIEVTEGEMDFPSFYWELNTPYGGTVSESIETYALADNGRDYDSLYPFKAGETYTYILLYDVQRAGGNKLVYNNWTDEYTWDVVA